MGSTEESILPDAVQQLKVLAAGLPSVERVYVSPRKRCVESAEILYSGKELTVVDSFAECDFGAFEYCNYEQLNHNPDYQRFIDSYGRCGFPGGEDRDTFVRRCSRGLEELLKREHRFREGDIGLVIHGGTIMALLDAFSQPHGDYYDWQVKNGQGYEMDVKWIGPERFVLCRIKALPRK